MVFGLDIKIGARIAAFIFLSHIFLSASSRRRNRRISNRDKVEYDSGRNTQHNSESILTVRCPFG
jgi:cytidylate kinase